MKRKILIVTGSLLLILAGLQAYAYVNTLGKTDLNIQIHINEKLVLESGFGESPTFAVWLENAETNEIRPVYVTRRAAEGDWEGKIDVPVALPLWFEVAETLIQKRKQNEEIDAYSGATPKPGYFTTKVNLEPESKWILWMEVNLAGDYNDTYAAAYNEENESDKYLSGQPAILYRGKLTAIKDTQIEMHIVGMTVIGSHDQKTIQPMKGITSATNIFDEIKITIEKPKPKIIQT